MKVTTFLNSTTVKLELSPEELSVILGFASLEEMKEGSALISIQDIVHDSIHALWNDCVTLEHTREP